MIVPVEDIGPFEDIVPFEDMAAAIEQVLQNMYFCEALYSGPGAIGAKTFGAAVHFSGSVRGEFRVRVLAAMAERMTTDFLALETGGVSVSQIDSTVKEFANIACGAALNAWMPSANFHFSVPEGLAAAEGENRAFPCCFSESDAPTAIGIDIRTY